jgi:signal transduction histidine kinase
LQQVFLNLVKNAMEAMDSGGVILIQSRLLGDEVEFVVADEGCGISEEDRERIFAPFFTTKKQGTGLGLCISKRIVEDQEGGSFSFESVEGKGTTFKVSLPVYRRTPEDAENSSQQVAGAKD